MVCFLGIKVGPLFKKECKTLILEVEVPQHGYVFETPTTDKCDEKC